jgi:H+/Cl- antiporter ClcA
MPAPRVKLLGSAGSFAGISILLESPLAGAFLLMEASALGGPQLPLVIVTVIVAYVAAARIAPRPGAQPTGGGQSDSGAHPDRASQA